MLCLTCAHDNQTMGPHCTECHADLGHLAENRGYLPQLEALSQQLEQGLTTSAQASERLQRLEQAVAYIISCLDETSASLDEAHQSFLLPVREGLETLLDAVMGLDPEGGWTQAQWEQLREGTEQVVRGNTGVTSLAQAVSATLPAE